MCTNEEMEAMIKQDDILRACEVIAERILNGESWDEIVEEIHNRVELIVCGQEAGMAEWKAKRGE